MLNVMNTLWNSLVFAKKCKENQLAQIVVYQGGLLLRGVGDRNHLYPCQRHHIRTTIQPTKYLITLFPLMFVFVVLHHSMFLQLVLFHKLLVCFVEHNGFIIFFYVCIFQSRTRSSCSYLNTLVNFTGSEELHTYM